MNNKNLFRISTLSILGLALGVSALVYKTNFLKTIGQSYEKWTHYSQFDPTYNEVGCREYWVSCTSNEHEKVFVKPTTGTIVEGNPLSKDFVKSLANDDPRIIKPTNTYINFDDGELYPLIHKWERSSSSISSIEVISDPSDTNRCLKITQSTSNKDKFGIYLDKCYFDSIFSNSDIRAITFDAKGSVTTNDFRHANKTYEPNNSYFGITTNWKTFSYTREMYEEDKTLTNFSFVEYGVYNGGACLYIDNIHPDTGSQYERLNFEGGNTNISGSDHTYRQSADNSVDFIASPTSVLTSASIDYSIKSEGRSSIKFIKTDGYCSFFARKNFISKVKNENYILAYDLYSTIGVNASNFVDGMNVSMGVAHSANTWQTYYVPSNKMTSDGRFLILLGSTAGTYYFDNFRLLEKNQYLEEYSNVQDIILDDKNELIIPFDLKHNIDSVTKVSIDDKIFNSSFIKGYSNNGDKGVVNISSNAFTNGEHIVNICYKFGSIEVSHTFYVTTYIPVTQNAINLNDLIYGTSDYYTLPNQYTDLYRITCNGKEVPFEKAGYPSTSYMVPVASLIELLPIQNNKKVSGSISLTLFTTTGTYKLPMNLNMSTSSGEVKAIPNYTGERIMTHAYTSSNQGENCTQNYLTNLSTERVADYANSGLDIMYEQLWHVGMNDTALNSQLNYLLDNAGKIGIKVIIADDFLNNMSKQESSIIGRDVVINGLTYRFENESELDAAIRTRLNMYINNPNVYGVNVIDEPSYAQLVGGVKDIWSSLKRVKASMNREDFYCNINILPILAGSEMLCGDASVDARVAFQTYCDKYFEVTGNTFLQCDYYHFTNDTSKFSGTGLSFYTFTHFMQCAEACKRHDADLWLVTQGSTLANGYYGYNNTYIMDMEDFALINNLCLSFGVRHISYFTYYERYTTGAESWITGGSVMKQDGSKTNLYYYMQGMTKQIHDISNVLSNFVWEWDQMCYSKTHDNAWAYQTTIDNKDQSLETTYGDLYETPTVDKDWMLVTGLKQRDSQNYLYSIQNISHDERALQTETIKLNSSKDANDHYAVIYECGSHRVVNLSTTRKYIALKVRYDYYCELSLKLSSGHSAFIMYF